MLFSGFANARSRVAPLPRRRGILPYLSLIRQRRDLANLDSHQLRDIGLEQAAADAEAKRPFWDVPDHWVR